ncbi:MAG: redoxin domain-containing protein [Planctomycetaceae bacterium]
MAESIPAAEPPSVKFALSFKPVQKDVDIETPKGEDFDKCKIKVERSGKSSGWVVIGPEGQILRRFLDADGNDYVDQWRYFKHGVEVYRDLDGNNNRKVDQSRWLNTGGSRWGLDTNEDGRIDSWKVLSAEEASREAVRAVVSGDEKALSAILISKDDIKTLGIQSSYSEKLLESVEDPGKKMRDMLSKSKSIGPKTVWMRFDNSTPCLIPADEGKSDNDIIVYENGMAIVESDGKPGLLQLGEMVRVGDVWKLTQIPVSIEGNSAQIAIGGILLQPALGSEQVAATADTPGVSPEIQKLLEELQNVDKNAPDISKGASALADYNEKRAGILTKLIDAAKTEEEKAVWTRQFADSMAAAVQFGGYADGLKLLKSLEADAVKDSAKDEVLSYIAYRRMTAEYFVESQGATGEKQQEVQLWWRKQLEQFAEKYPNGEDAAEALLQLAIAHEFNGKPTDAREWYQKLVKTHGDSRSAQRGQGALKRLDLKGKKPELSGPGISGGTIDLKDYRGKAVLVVYWSTWCVPCTQDLPVLRALYEQYHDRGFEIVGVNLDATPENVLPYMKEHKMTWPQIYEPGGLESGPAVAMGIIVPPVMFLVDGDGTVVSPIASVDDLKAGLPDLLKKKK